MTSVFQRSLDGRWVARVKTPDGYRHVTGATRSDVEARLPALLATLPVRDPSDRFWAMVDRGPGCWVWRGARKQLGYGLYRVGAKLKQAHRVAYELMVGPIPDGLVLDHLCRNPECVNPAHLEPVTHQENIRRGYAAKRARQSGGGNGQTTASDPATGLTA